MAYASALNDAGYLAILQPAPGSWDGDHRRLGYCLAVSAIVIFAGLAILRVPVQLGLIRQLPVVLDVRLRESAKRPEKQAAPPTETVPSSVPEQRTAPVPSVAEEADLTQAPVREAPIDWQGALERASADVVARSAETPSLHPEFDELRRIAAVRYAKPETGKPPPIWEHVEKDPYGRTVVRLGNCYKVLDDPNVGNRYAFETFEKTMTSCNLSNPKPKNLPWVEEIRARYAYLRNPDGVDAADRPGS